MSSGFNGAALVRARRRVLLAATADNAQAAGRVYDIALGERTTLNELFRFLKAALRQRIASLPYPQPVYRDFRPGDVRHSLADIGLARQRLGYVPTHRVREALELAMEWYQRNAV